MVDIQNQGMLLYRLHAFEHQHLDHAFTHLLHMPGFDFVPDLFVFSSMHKKEIVCFLLDTIRKI